MTRFWLATFAMSDAAEDVLFGPDFASGKKYIAVEVLMDESKRGVAVLFSSVADPNKPEALSCHVGFTNVAKACNVWLDRGFPLVDAVINTTPDGGLAVKSPFFGPEQSTMQYDAELLSLSGLEWAPAFMALKSSTPVDVGARYDQFLQSPDGARPDLLTARAPVTWSPARHGVHQFPREYLPGIVLTLTAPPARSPSLPVTSGPLTAIAAWTGDLVLPLKNEGSFGDPLELDKIAHRFGLPAFRFEDVEVLGFRIDVAELDIDDHPARLAELVKPLNFHLRESEEAARPLGRKPTADFRYRAATPTVVIELLRYGRMRSRAPRLPLTPEDSQSQHELVVRLLVGRVDDDSAQAHDPAVFVPAIFVDNPWSKILGRDSIGYDKRMAQFCVNRGSGPVPLLPDGRVPGAIGAAATTPEPLGAIMHIKLVGLTGGSDEGDAMPLMDLEFSTTEHRDPDALTPIDLDLAFGTSLFSGTRWRQSDFDDAEFRRSFASDAVSESVREFRSIQVAPVAQRGALRETWITGKFLLDDDVRAALPFGVASLTLHAIPDAAGTPMASASRAWNLLCEMLGNGKTPQIRLTTGNWYRLLCSMDLTLDDGLD